MSRHTLAARPEYATRDLDIAVGFDPHANEFYGFVYDRSPDAHGPAWVNITAIDLTTVIAAARRYAVIPPELAIALPPTDETPARPSPSSSFTSDRQGEPTTRPMYVYATGEDKGLRFAVGRRLDGAEVRGCVAKFADHQDLELYLTAWRTAYPGSEVQILQSAYALLMASHQSSAATGAPAEPVTDPRPDQQ